MTFKEVRKFGREELQRTHRSYGFINKEKNKKENVYYFTEYFDPQNTVFVLEKNGVVDKVINGKWKWDFQKRGMYPKNEKGWPQKMRKTQKKKDKNKLNIKKN